MLRRWVPVGLLLLASAAVLAQDPTALELVPPDRVNPDDPPEEILYRQLDLWHYRRNEGRYEEILERLWLADSPYYCAGLARLGNNFRLEQKPVEAAAWYRRAVRECALSGWAILGLAEIAVQDQGLCRQARDAVGEDRTALAERRLPFAAAETGWTADELEYFGLVGAAMIRRTCGDGLVDRRDLDRMIAIRGAYSFARMTRPLEDYVEAMIRADLALRAGDSSGARRDLHEAVRRACRSRETAAAVVDAVAREVDAPLAFNLNLGAVGLLQELWDRGMLDTLEGSSRRCLQEMLHTLRRAYRRESDSPEIREWYAELDRQLRRSE
jgi:hypothetical protein